MLWRDSVHGLDAILEDAVGHERSVGDGCFRARYGEK